MKGSIDGLDLTLFHPGQVYDVSAALATYLTASGHAMPIADERPARVIPWTTTLTISGMAIMSLTNPSHNYVVSVPY